MNVFIAHIQDNVFGLPPEESWHCAKVLRFKSGQKINLIDGKGSFYEAELQIVTEKKCEGKILAGPRRQLDSNYQLHLAIAPTKQIDRIEWMLEKAVEIGIHEITLFTSHNSERTSVKQERLQTIIESAVKQSLQARIPKLNNIVDFKTLLKISHQGPKYIAHCYEEKKVRIHDINFRDNNTLVVIGPEGDFSKEEIQLASQVGFLPLSLGANRLRTETAGLYVCQAASILSI